MKKPKVCILRSAGTNCDKETAFAFQKAGAEVELVHINKLISAKCNLDNFQILALPGGFSYGDDLGAGRILANELRFKLIAGLKEFIKQGKLIIGICNGFQILVKSGLLPGNADFKQEASLIINDSGKFEDRWVYLKSSQKKCVWTKDLPEVIYLPVAHGEGKFVVQDKAILERLNAKEQIVFRYCNKAGQDCRYPENPNGSIEDVAGISDETGRILGLMPHPERHIDSLQHPHLTDSPAKNSGEGLLIFKNGVEFAVKNL